MANDVETRDDTSGETTDTPVPSVDPGISEKCGLFSFPWLVILSVAQLAIYLNKLYQDGSAVGKYFTDEDSNSCIVSAACLFAPAVVYIIYIVSAYIKEQEEPEKKEIGSRVVHGLLLIPWQIKKRVDVLQFSVQRICEARPLTPAELEEKFLLEKQATVLQFFEQFYAGFTQLLLQLYIVIRALDEKQPYKAITDEIVASGLILMAMMAAVRRRDDSWLPKNLSTIGWVSIMISRSVAIVLAARVIYGWIFLICVVHGLLVALWVTYIAIGTYPESSPFSKKREISLYFVVFTVFGLPSLIYWPIMFELRKNKRPLIFLSILLFENVLFVGMWELLRENRTWFTHDFIVVSVTAGCFVFGSLFIFLYICIKPPYTDDVVYHDMKKASDAESFGMYFEFCDIAFKLETKEVVATMLKEIREQEAAP